MRQSKHITLVTLMLASGIGSLCVLAELLCVFSYCEVLLDSLCGVVQSHEDSRTV